jgi:hypothetical protein
MDLDEAPTPQPPVGMPAGLSIEARASCADAYDAE